MPKKVSRLAIKPKLIAKKFLSQRKSFAARFAAAPRNRTRLKQTALKRVKRWEYFSAPARNLNPGYFFMEHNLDGAFLDVRPGRKLSGKPALRGKMVRHGLDKDGNLHVIEHADGSEEFWQYFDDRIEAVVYEKDRPPSLQILWPAAGRPEAVIFYSQGARTLRVYVYDESGQLGHVVEGKWYDEKAPGQIDLREVWPEHAKRFALHTGQKTPSPKPKNPVPILNLQQELPETAAFLERAIGQFAERQKKRTRRIAPVCAIGIQFRHYDHEAVPEFLVSFDTRDRFENDGTWTHQFTAALKRPRWKKYCAAESQGDDNQMLVDAAGKKHWIDDRSQPLRWFGGMLGQALLTASGTAAFKALAKTRHCKLLVHDVDFAFHWQR